MESVEENKNKEEKHGKHAKHENKELIELKEKVKELENKMLYKDAELINYRKRKDDEVSQMLKYANSDLILHIISIVDDFERAISMDDEILDDEVSKFLSGFKMIYTRLLKILEDFEVKEIDALNKEFDPKYHQAVFTTKVEGTNPNVVLEVLQKGYIYKDRVIRPAMVKVSE